MRSILLYHNIARKVSPFGSTIPPEVFERHLRFFKKKNIPIISIEEYLEGKEGIVITFDDGFTELAEYLPPLMERFCFTPVVFVVTGFMGKKSLWDTWPGKGNKHLTVQEVKRLKEMGVIFGSHSHTHPDLSRSGYSVIKMELKLSKEILEDLLGEKISYVSYPFGRWNNEVLEIAKDVGYEWGFTSVPLSDEKKYLIGRWGVYIIDPGWSILNKSYKDSLPAKIEFYKCKFINALSNGTYLIKKMEGLFFLSKNNVD